ncbi:MAG: outer membrane lipoprotein-sorting protein [Deltaproteobacteria bacterium]|nr:outer membrane lipoprotein-sorting protein [Deltaproteobacteria bacterium]
MKKIFAILCGVAFAAPAFGQDDDAKEIFRKSIDKNTFGMEGAVSRVKMELSNRRGETSERVVLSKSRKFGGLRNTVVCFASPDDVKGTSFLVNEKRGRKDDQFLFLPELSKVRRIAASQRSGSFMGTDFAYADLESQNVDDAEYKSLPEDELGTHVIEVTPKESAKNSDIYSKIIYWIDKQSYIARRAKFFDKRGAHLKTMFVKETAVAEGREYVKVSKMQNVKKRHSTVLAVESITFKVDDLGDEVFQLETLKQGRPCN